MTTSTYLRTAAIVALGGAVLFGSGTAMGGAQQLKPSMPTALNPVDKSSNVAANPTLFWSSSRANAYFVFFGTQNPPPFKVTRFTTTFRVPTSPSTTYYWQIAASNSVGTSRGPVWSFTTAAAPSTPPTTPTSPTPSDGAGNTANNPTLGWTSSGASSYTVAFGTTNPPPTKALNLTSKAYPTSTVAGTTYFWQVRAVNSTGNAAGPVWSFKTAAAPPQIACPSDQSVASPDGDAVVVTYPAAVLSGGLGPVTASYSQASGTMFAVGQTTVTATATAADGQTASCSFGVMVAYAPPVTDAASFGIWTPTARDTCTKAQHDMYWVIGPDGKRYPTWHPPTGPNGCTFGHEHGRDPRRSMLWPQIQRYFWLDANANGVMDPEEAAVTGLAFGYANEQMDVYYASQGVPVMRHEDHVGHKVDWADGEGDLATDRMNTSVTAGVWIGKIGNGIIQYDTGVRCHFLSKVHQGVSTADAFTMNLHEVQYFASCTHPNPAYNQQISIVKMMAFNKPGGFTKFMPMCGIQRRNDPQDFLWLGTNSMNAMYPPGPGDREILTRDCLEIGFLVRAGSWSGNLYEAWSAPLYIYDTGGRAIAWGINLFFDVEDAARYYYPEDLKLLRGYTNPDAGVNRGFAMDLCYDTSLASLGRISRGGPCEWATNYGAIKDITWDDPRSAFRGVHRGLYFAPAVLDNAGGPSTWYTDPFGNKGSPVPFPGALRQQITSGKINYSTLIGGQAIDPRVTDRWHDDGSGTVHTPN